MATATATIIKFELAGRSVIWNPKITGFDGLNAMLDNPVTSGEVDSEKQPILFAAVQRALESHILNVVDSTEKKIAPRRASAPTEKKEEMPSLDGKVAKMLLEFDVESILKHIEKCNDISELQILMEKESIGKNKAGRPRDKVRELIKQKIREIDAPIL